MYKILLVENDKQDCEEISLYNEEITNYDITFCENGIEAIKILKSKKFDVVVSAMTLQHSDGLDILNYMNEKNIIDKTYFFVRANAISGLISQEYTRLGCDMIILKPYTTRSFMNKINTAINSNYKDIISNNVEIVNENSINNIINISVEQFANDILNKINFKTNLKGYYLLLEAINYVHAKGAYNVQITKDIYPHLSHMHNIKVENIERNIRTSIKTSMNEHNIKNYYKLVGKNPIDRIPTNAEFIYDIVRQYNNIINKAG